MPGRVFCSRNHLFKLSESLWQQKKFCILNLAAFASAGGPAEPCWWMTATSYDIELTAFKSLKGCELIATAFGWPSVPDISLPSEARNIFLKGRSKLDVGKHFASVLQPVPSRTITCMS